MNEENIEPELKLTVRNCTELFFSLLSFCVWFALVVIPMIYTQLMVFPFYMEFMDTLFPYRLWYGELGNYSGLFAVFSVSLLLEVLSGVVLVVIGMIVSCLYAWFWSLFLGNPIRWLLSKLPD
ncbi:membrane hypothetical protein [Vibrio chagasii]|nr:membrane hypothetical protein [Vibrio chagasii]